MEKNIKIYVAAHKEANFPKDKIYVPIQVGAEGKKDLGYVRDNTGDNIAKKNANYCELTALYWIWKNICNVTNVGICHYRRYFAKNIWSNNERKFIDKETIMIITSDNKLLYIIYGDNNVHEFNKKIKDVKFDGNKIARKSKLKIIFVKYNNEYKQAENVDNLLKSASSLEINAISQNSSYIP